MPKPHREQLELFTADISWFHIFKEFIRAKTWAEMSPASKALYPTIKAFTNWKDGRSFPSLDTLQEYSGLTRPSVIKGLKELEGLGYIQSKKKPGKQTIYKLIEKFGVRDQLGRPVASASFDYLPGIIQDATLELKNYIAQGMKDDGNLQYIHIDRLTINIAGRDVIGTQNINLDSAMIAQGMKDMLEGKDTPEAIITEQILDGMGGLNNLTPVQNHVNKRTVGLSKFTGRVK